MLAATLKVGQSVRHEMGEGRGVYLVPTAGSLRLNGKRDIPERAGVGVVEEDSLDIEALEDSEIVLVGMPYPWHPRQGIMNQ